MNVRKKYICRSYGIRLVTKSFYIFVVIQNLAPVIELFILAQIDMPGEKRWQCCHCNCKNEHDSNICVGQNLGQPCQHRRCKKNCRGLWIRKHRKSIWHSLREHSEASPSRGGLLPQGGGPPSGQVHWHGQQIGGMQQAAPQHNGSEIVYTHSQSQLGSNVPQGHRVSSIFSQPPQQPQFVSVSLQNGGQPVYDQAPPPPTQLDGNQLQSSGWQPVFHAHPSSPGLSVPQNMSAWVGLLKHGK